MRKRGYVCLNPADWANMDRLISSFQGFSLFTTTPIPSYAVRRIKSDLGAKLLFYNDAYHPPYPGGSATVGVWKRLADALPARGWLKNGTTGEYLSRWDPRTGIYSHDEETVYIYANWLKEIIAGMLVDGGFQDNMEPVMPDWLMRYYAFRTPIVNGNGSFMTSLQIKVRFDRSNPKLTAAIRKAVGPDAIIVANTGVRRDDPAINGICLERNFTPASWMGMNWHKPYYPLAMVYPNTESVVESMVLPANVYRMRDGTLGYPVPQE